MGTTLSLNTAELQDTGTALRQVAEEFTNASDNSTTIGDAVGHDELRSRIDEFISNWDDKRDEMVESIDGLGDVAEGIGDAFEEIETELAKTLKEGQ